MKKLKYISGLILSIAFAFSSCQKVDREFGDIIAPSSVQIFTQIVGQDDTHPNGDGSGEVIFTVKAANAITYKFVYDGVETMAPSGTKTYAFSKTGTFKYTVTAVAIGTAGVTSSVSTEVEVLTLYSPPADLLTMLTADSERTWRIAAETPGHFGVGPADSPDPIWWAAAPFDKDGLGAYDDRFVFNVDGTFTHITNGTAYGKAAAMNTDIGDPGMDANGDGEYVNYPLADYSEGWALSAPGGQETLTFSNIGYHGFYVGGDHSYVILSRSANEMNLRTVGADGLGWFVKLIAVEE
ncbi:MAG: hypothetical protein JW729_05355 [Bacteroidales bacterium]|nr:hypothetical protein [Bacteroidales bacterium]